MPREQKLIGKIKCDEKNEHEAHRIDSEKPWWSSHKDFYICRGIAPEPIHKHRLKLAVSFAISTSVLFFDCETCDERRMYGREHIRQMLMEGVPYTQFTHLWNGIPVGLLDNGSR